MKTYRSPNLITPFLLALAFTLGPVLRAQPAEPAPATQPSQPAQPVPDDSSEKKAVAPEVPAPQAEAAAEPAPSAEQKKIESSESTEAQSPVKPESKGKDKKSKAGKSWKHNHNHGHGHVNGNAQVSFFSNSTLEAGQQSDDVVSIIGSSTAHGPVDGAVVSILGSSTAHGPVGDAVVSVLGSSTSSGEVGGPVVSVLGNTRVTGGSVGDVAVSVLGNTYVNGPVRHDVVAVLGNVELGPDAVVEGGIVCIGGAVKRDPKAEVHGHIQNVAIAGRFFQFDWLNTWIAECLLYGRPLAFNANVMWAWWIALACLGFYGLLALIAPRGVVKCAQTLEERPGYSILSAILTMLLTPITYLLLFITVFIGIGFVIIPLFSLGLFFASLFGKAVILTWLGRRFTKLFGDGPLGHPAFAVLVGGIVVLGLYTVPVVGFLVYKLIGLLGLGVVLYTLLRSSKRDRPVPPPASAGPAVTAPLGAESVATPAAASPVPPVMVSSATLPRAGFWLRFAALFLDMVLVGLVFTLLGIWKAYPVGLVIYTVAMWVVKGTTIGGIICGLKVVRIDDRPLDWSVAIVRALSAFLSLVVAGLGFIWVAFDDDRQSWHDKIAGTTVVQVPKGTPLL